MEDGVDMKKLVELIYGKKATIPEQTVEGSSIHAKWLTKDFLKRLHDVLFFKKAILFHAYRKEFDEDIHKMLSSHREYLINIMLVCFCEFALTRNAFDCFLNVSTMVIIWNEKTLEKTGVNFSDLNLDIFIIFYRKVLKDYYFKKSRDFYRLVEYISNHKYLKWNRSHLILTDDPTTLFRESNAQIREEIRRSHSRISLDRNAAYLVNAMCLAEEVLSTISIELPTLPNEFDFIERLVESRKREMAKKADKKKRVEAHLVTEVPQKYSNTVEKTNHFETKQEDIDQYENIIQAVIRHNHSKNKGNENDQILEKADGVIKHLKDSINSLAEVLDEFSKNE